MEYGWMQMLTYDGKIASGPCFESFDRMDRKAYGAPAIGPIDYRPSIIRLVSAMAASGQPVAVIG